MRHGWLPALALIVASCHGEGLETAEVPEGLRADYALFAQRCSRCHSLARPLQSGITDDAFWRRYVEQMRLKPGSGISREDEEGILRFLHFYSLRQRRPDASAEAP